LFTVHHNDNYPAGNDQMGPAASLAGRDIGQDFDPKAAWRMYHGETVPGFPSHPHRGFETVTVVRQGLIDHFDSLGATSRFGNGDVQWLTAGAGVQHAEMFPLVNPDGGNPLELFQIWLNLPAKAKMVAPYYSMLWAEDLPRAEFRDGAGKLTTVEITAGTIGGIAALPPPPDSWAAQATADLAIWVIRLEPGASWDLPAASAGLNRNLYYYQGESLEIGGTTVRSGNGIGLLSDQSVRLKNGGAESYLLLLQGRPIGEPVATYGPFVMNTQAEIEQTYADFRRTQFGGWPWPKSDPVHPRSQGRFARYPDGKEESR